MNKYIVVMMFICSGANAANAVFVKNVGSGISAESAILSAASGEVVYKCQQVEMKLSKSGTSVSLRNVKKKITAEQAADKIKEIEKQRDQ